MKRYFSICLQVCIWNIKLKCIYMYIFQINLMGGTYTVFLASDLLSMCLWFWLDNVPNFMYNEQVLVDVCCEWLECMTWELLCTI